LGGKDVRSQGRYGNKETTRSGENSAIKKVGDKRLLDKGSWEGWELLLNLGMLQGTWGGKVLP